MSKRGRALGLALPLALAAALAAGCATTRGPASRADGEGEVGIASWYGAAHRGRRTASGERFDPEALTAAHRTLAFGTRVRVRRLANGRTVVVVVNDRGPARTDRIIDLSRAAARALGMLEDGTARVRLEVLGP